VPGFCKGGRQYSFLEWLLLETEQVHGKIRRYTSPDEHPFFPDELPSLVLPPLEFPSVLAPFSDEINYNPQIMRVYLEEVIPAVTRNGSDNNHGSSCLIDVTLLQVNPPIPPIYVIPQVSSALC
jgi:chorismate mutase